MIWAKKSTDGGGTIGAHFGRKGPRNHQGGCGFSSSREGGG